MIVIGSTLVGAIFGGLSASRRGGRLADIAQYATVYGIAFCLAGLIATIALDRLLRG